MRKMGFAAIAAMAVVVLTAGAAQAVELTNSGSNVSIATAGSLNPNSSNCWAGEAYADAMGNSIAIQREFRRALPSIYSYSQTAHYQDRADAGVSGEAYADVASGEATSSVACPTTLCAPGSKWVMWDVPFYMREVQKETDGALGYTSKVSGFATGISRMLGESSAIGFAAGYDARRLARKDGYHFRNNADTLHLALYGGTNIGSFFLDAYAGWSRAWNRMEREVVDFAGRRVSLNKANYRDDVWSAGVKASYVWILANDVRVTPSLGLDFSHVRQEGINERMRTDIPGIDSRLRSGRSTYSNLAIPLTVSVNRTFASNFLTLKGAQSLWTPEIRGGYVPIVGDKRADVDFTSANPVVAGLPPINFKTTSAKFAGSYGTAGAGLKMKLADKYIFGGEYDYTFGDKYRNHSLNAMYGVSF
ncbi:MAG: autotransporter outer membrane beta-barrel domain-containing protein [Planctomycetaceae bacterium]|nr:autotransporter outer membrane beta-barrel domain-containing protein [Planctomycetaceae bacterium]